MESFTTVRQPYIGMTGVTTPKEAEVAARIADQCNRRSTAPHMAHIGVLVNDDTFRAKRTRNNRYPPLETLPKIFAAALNTNFEVFTVVHYTCGVPEQLMESVRRILCLPGMYYDGEESALCQAVQLNGGLGRIYLDQLQRIKEEYPATSIILQVSPKDLTLSTKEVVLQLKDKVGYIDYILLDSSGGREKSIDVCTVVPFAKAIFVEFGKPVGFAGGFDRETVNEAVSELVTALGTADFSIDTECGLRTTRAQKHGDAFDPKKAEGYYTHAVRALSFR